MDREKEARPDRRRRGAFTRRRSALLVDLVTHGSSTAPEIAHRLGVHTNTVRDHLARLVAERFVTSRPARRGSRGRPQVRFTLADPDGAPILEESTVRSAVDVARAADRLAGGDAAGARLEQYAVITGHLDRHGFEPVDDAEGIVVACPITESWREHGDRLCSAHVRLLERVLRQADGPPGAVRYRAHVTPGACRLRLVDPGGSECPDPIPGGSERPEPIPGRRGA